MTKILHIISTSTPGQASLSKQVGTFLLDCFAQKEKTDVITHDLIQENVPHIGPEFVGAMFSEEAKTAKVLETSNRMTAELLATDIVVIESPMYNLGIPSVLKAWIDHVVRSGMTFRHTEEGIEGMVKGKKAILILSRSGMYSEGAAKQMDFQETYLRAILTFMGITEIETIMLEGTFQGEEWTQKALTAAREKAQKLTQNFMK